MPDLAPPEEAGTAAAGKVLPVPAIVLAGDRRGSHPVLGANKNLLEVGNEPIVRHVVATLLEVAEVAQVFVVGPEAELQRALAGLAGENGRRPHIVPQRETLVQNCWRGFRRCLGAGDGADLDHLKADHADAVALFLSGDLPLLDPGGVSHFLSLADMERHDYLLGLTRAETLERVLSEAGIPELRKPALQMAEGRMRQNNLFLIRPFAVRHLEYFDRFYEVRYQRELWNTVKVIWALLRASGGISRPLGYYLFAQAAMRADLVGLERLAAWFRRRVPMARVCAAMSRFMGCRFGFLTVASAGAVLDVDTEKDLELIQMHLDRLRRLAADGWTPA